MKTAIQPVFTVHLNHIRNNYQILSAKASPARTAAVVKDNAYGLGAEHIVRTLYPTCSAFFVAYAWEGAQIRPFAPKADIYVLQGIGADDLKTVKENCLIPVLSSLEDVAWWHNQGITDIKPALQIDTGLNRLGMRPADLHLLTSEQRRNISLFMSHLACPDTPDHPMNAYQRNIFEECRQLFPHVPLSLSASGGTLLGSEYTYDLVRIGALLYGITRPTPDDLGLKSALTVQARVLQTVPLNAGESISYGATFTAAHPMKIAIVSIGYGDGLFVSLSNKGRFWVDGKSLPILGRVCMDSTICDITKAPDLRPGDLIDVLNDTYTPDDMARDAGTSAYEILSRFGKGIRFIRRYEK